MSQAVIALIIIAVMIALFIWEKFPIVVTAIAASSAFYATGLIKLGDNLLRLQQHNARPAVRHDGGGRLPLPFRHHGPDR